MAEKRQHERDRVDANRLRSGYRLRCASCGEAFDPLPVKWAEAIVLLSLGAERFLTHFEPCSITLRSGYQPRRGFPRPTAADGPFPRTPHLPAFKAEGRRSRTEADSPKPGRRLSP